MANFGRKGVIKMLSIKNVNLTKVVKTETAFVIEGDVETMVEADIWFEYKLEVSVSDGEKVFQLVQTFEEYELAMEAYKQINNWKKS